MRDTSSGALPPGRTPRRSRTSSPASELMYMKPALKATPPLDSRAPRAPTKSSRAMVRSPRSVTVYVVSVCPRSAKTCVPKRKTPCGDW